MRTRYIAILVGTESDIVTERLKVRPDVEVYRIDGPNPEHQTHEIEMALLNDLVIPIRLCFVGGEDARHYAEMYRGTWIKDGPSAVGDILRCWSISGASTVSGHRFNL
jgi:hypothetical protein